MTSRAPLLRVAAAVVLAVSGFFLPRILGGSSLVYDTLVVIAIFSAMSYGLDIVLSDLGEISLAHTAFFATGAYAAAVLTVTYRQNAWIAMAGAVLASLALALVLGVITLRTREFAFSLVTYAAAIVCMNIASNWDFLGGSDGIVGIPPLDLSIGRSRSRRVKASSSGLSLTRCFFSRSTLSSGFAARASARRR